MLYTSNFYIFTDDIFFNDVFGPCMREYYVCMYRRPDVTRAGNYCPNIMHALQQTRAGDYCPMSARSVALRWVILGKFDKFGFSVLMLDGINACKLHARWHLLFRRTSGAWGPGTPCFEGLPDPQNRRFPRRILMVLG